MPEMPQMQALADRLEESVGGHVLTGYEPLGFSALKTFAPPLLEPRTNDLAPFLHVLVGEALHLGRDAHRRLHRGGVEGRVRHVDAEVGREAGAVAQRDLGVHLLDLA